MSAPLRLHISVHYVLERVTRIAGMLAFRTRQTARNDESVQRIPTVRVPQKLAQAPRPERTNKAPVIM